MSVTVKAVARGKYFYLTCDDHPLINPDGSYALFSLEELQWAETQPNKYSHLSKIDQLRAEKARSALYGVTGHNLKDVTPASR